jgi:hypothetical protein
MKKTILFGCLWLMASIAWAQTLTADNVTDKGGYAESKLKNAPRKVYIASFRTFFHVLASAEASSIGGSFKGNTKTSMVVAVSGVDTPDFLEVTNTLYKKFTDDLKAKGFEILTADDAARSEEYSDWIKKEGGTLSYSQIPGYVSASPTGYNYFIKKEKKDGREKSAFLDKSTKISRDLDGAIIIEAAFAFPFVDMKTASSSMAGFSSVKAKIDFEIGTAFGMDGANPLMSPTQLKFINSEGMGKDAILYVKIKDDSFDSDAPVFKDKKFKESNVAIVSYKPDYYGVVWKEEQTVKVSHYAECDNALYKQETTRLASEFTDQALAIFYKNALKK